MIKRKDDIWTTIQCPKCKDCHKVLNGKHRSILQCPYCDRQIDLRQFPKVKKEDTIGYQLAQEAKDTKEPHVFKPSL